MGHLSLFICGIHGAHFIEDSASAKAAKSQNFSGSWHFFWPKCIQIIGICDDFICKLELNATFGR